MARAETFTWIVRSLHPNRVQIEFYSQLDHGSWPGDDDAYVLDDNSFHQFVLGCDSGDRADCKSCCSVCDGGKREITLKP